MKSKGGYVYLICDPTNERYKIGVSRREPTLRIGELQTGNAVELHVVNYYRTDYPFRMETMLHAKYKPQNELNEWFELSSEDVTNFMNTCTDIDKTIEKLKENPFFAKGLK